MTDLTGMKRTIFFCLSLLLCFDGLTQSVEGLWVTTDDKRGVEIAVVQLFQKENLLSGKIIRLLPDALVRTCAGCSGDLKDRPLEGLILISGLHRDGRQWTGGTFLDPKSGRKYNLSIWPDGRDTLKVRASYGFSFLGRTQTWKRYHGNLSSE